MKTALLSSVACFAVIATQAAPTYDGILLIGQVAGAALWCAWRLT